MKNFLVALGFLTIFPVKTKQITEESFAKSMIYFPLVGFLIGVFLVIINFVLNLVFLPMITNVLLLVFLVVISGALHIDGFADVCDGFFCHKQKQDVLNIMKDSRIGVFALVGVLLLVLTKFACLNSLTGEKKSYLLLISPMFSRFAMVFITSLGKSARTGLNELYIKHINKKILLFASIITLILSVLISLVLHNWRGILAIHIVLALCLLISFYSRKRIDGITGDVIGATGEFAEMMCFLLLATK